MSASATQGGHKNFFGQDNKHHARVLRLYAGLRISVFTSYFMFKNQQTVFSVFMAYSSWA